METTCMFLVLILGAAGVLGSYDYYDYWGEERSETSADDKVWHFSLGDNWGAYEYLDAEGYMKGFHPDLVKAVCEAAGKSCYWTIDTYQNCWKTDGGMELPGQGLMEGWYDGCISVPSPERQNSFDFTKSWTTTPSASLFYRKDDIKGDPNDLSGRKIGLINGLALSRRCLAREPALRGNQLHDYEAVFYDTIAEIVNGLQKKEIDACLLDTTYHSEGIVRTGPYLSCTSAGSAVMGRYGDPLIKWWNAAFDDMVESGEFNDLCKRAQREHGARGRINCIL